MPYTEANSRLMIIDDRDPAVQYEGSWGRDVSFGDTISTSLSVNASVSLEFDGTRIIVAALAVPDNNTYTAVPAVQFTIDGHAQDPVPGGTFTEWTFYPIIDSQGLTDGNHTINITVTATTDAYPFYLDYFMFQPSKKYWNLAISPTTLDAAPADEGDNTGTTTTTVASASSSGGKKAPVGAIAGGVVGGLALLALAVGAFLWWRRRRQHIYTSIDGGDEPKSGRTVTPFTSTRASSLLSTDSKHAYNDPSDPLSSASSTSPAVASTSNLTTYPLDPSLPPSSPSEHSSTGATAGPSTETPSAAHLAIAPGTSGYVMHEVPHLHSMHGRVGLGDAGGLSGKEVPSNIVQLYEEARQRPAGLGVAGDSTLPASTPTEAPPGYSEQ
ncbi:hypothetical protein C8Q79DRAFT_1012874 [Trametes meyenii]|nr:hypothetical protein C8Q79DRAFT_1012874 [Trametes meyenii]